MALAGGILEAGPGEEGGFRLVATLPGGDSLAAIPQPTEDANIAFDRGECQAAPTDSPGR